jgi:uncharacterized protein YciI
MRLATALVLLSLLSPALSAAEPGKKWDMTTFTLALVRPGPADKQPGAEQAPAFAAKHQSLLRGLAQRSQAALVWGAIEGSPDLLEVIVLDVPEPEEARSLLQPDPWVRSGARILELHPWFAAKGILTTPAPGAPETSVTFGLLRRPANAPQFPEEKLEEIQKGHMANIEAMAASGDLAIAGPLSDDGALRGVFVFRGTDQAHLRALAGRDPAIQAGRLVLDLHAWSVGKGAVPAP